MALLVQTRTAICISCCIYWEHGVGVGPSATRWSIVRLYGLELDFSHSVDRYFGLNLHCQSCQSSSVTLDT